MLEANNVRGEAKELCWWDEQRRSADKQISFEPNLPTNMTLLEFCDQYNIDKHYRYSVGVPKS